MLLHGGGAGRQIIHNRQTLIFVCRGMKYPICHLQFFFFGDNIASARSPIPREFKTILNFKIKLVAAPQGRKKSNYPHLQTFIFECRVINNPICHLHFFFFGHNIASACSPIPWEFKTVLNSKIKLAAATWGGGESNYPQSTDAHFRV